MWLSIHCHKRMFRDYELQPKLTFALKMSWKSDNLSMSMHERLLVGFKCIYRKGKATTVVHELLQ